MMRCLVGFAVMGLLAACHPDVFSTSPEVKGLKGAAPMQTLVDPRTDSSVTLRPGKKLVLRLKSNPTTGYYWYETIGNDAVVELVSNEYAPDPAPEGITGSGGAQVFTFTGVAPGRTEIDLVYKRSAGDVADRLSVRVEVKE